MKKQINSLSIEEARLLILKSQGLISTDFVKGKKGTLAAIEHLSYIQIDTLSVVARAHHHTLWSRLTDYKENYLNDLLEKDKTIFEYWSYAASYLPMSNYRFSLPRKKSYSEGKSHWFEQNKKMKKYVLDKIKTEGPLQSKDFEHKRTVDANWYEWKPAKRALEQLFMEGKLMVAKRQGFQKVYDLAERVLPLDIDTSIPTEKEYIQHLVKKSIESFGIVNENEVAYLRTGLKESTNKVLKQLLKEGSLIELTIDGIDKTTFISTETQLKSIEKIKTNNNIHLLSPFDNLVIQRKRLERIFNFDYQIECYVPEPKRKYGYFTLPVLYKNNLVARFDPKADRAMKIFYIKSMHFEKGFQPNEDFNILFAEKLNSFANFTGCNKIVIEKANSKWKKEIMNMV